MSSRGKRSWDPELIREEAEVKISFFFYGFISRFCIYAVKGLYDAKYVEKWK